MYRKKGSKFFMTFLVGSVIGGLITFLFSPKKGKDVRNDLWESTTKWKEGLENYLAKVKQVRNRFTEEAQKLSDDLYIKVEKLNSLIEKYSQDSFKEPVEKIENEIASLKKAIKAAVDNYKESHKSKNSDLVADDIFIDFVNENLDKMDEELMPKHEGMHKRRGKK